MKKTLLLSVVASTMIMAGGDIAPVEPVVEAPVETSAWTFGGDMVAYTQTRDLQGTGDLFGGDETAGNLVLSLRANNADIFAGIGFGAEVTSIGTGSKSGYSNSNFGIQTGDALTQGYLTYGFDNINTSVKVGRQHLPKGLSPFAFTESWQPVKNSFEAALVVNSSIPNTTLVYAYVTKANESAAVPGLTGDINHFARINPTDAVNMLTIQNKSIENLTLTGTWYYAPDMMSNVDDALGGALTTLGVTGLGDVNVLWGDASYNAGAFTLGLQGGQISPDADQLDDTTAYGIKIAGDLGGFDLSAAYTSVDDGFIPTVNLGTGVKTPLYTQSILDQDTISLDADTFKLAAGMKALGGKFGLAYINADLGTFSRGAVMYGADRVSASGTYEEIDLTYKTKVTDNTTVFAGYVYQNDDRYVNESQDFLRFWARYNF